jgi:hypothetical protein
MFSEFKKIYESFQGGGSLDEEIETNINEELGINFEEDILAALSGRITYVQGIQDPPTFNSATSGLAIGLKDPTKFQELVDVFLKKIREEEGEDEIEEVDFKGVKFWKQPDSNAERTRERMREGDGPQIEMRIPQPCFGIVGDHLIISDSPAFLEQCILTDRGDEKALVDDEDFNLVAGKMTRLLESDMPSAVLYSQPDDIMRTLFEFAKADDTGKALDKLAEQSEFAGRMRDTLKKHTLPEFEEIEYLFQPSGAFITDDETGIHILAFQMKHEKK